MRKLILIISLFWQIPLFILSFLFKQCLVGTRKIIAQFIWFSPKKGSLKWRTASESLKQPYVLPYIMVTGPRWNCHVVAGSLGPFKVQSSIEIQVETAQKSAQQWTIVLYTTTHKMHTYISSTDYQPGESWQKIYLETGIYSITLRYYNCQDGVSCPAVKIDNMARVTARSMENEMQDYQRFLGQIQNHCSILYYGIHYYIFHLLQWRKWFPESFVRREYLPIGNPETLFYYGSLQKGEILQVDFDKILLSKTNVYITFLNRCSFPVFWETITHGGYRTQPVPGDGYYLIRVICGYKEECSDFLSEIHCCKILTRESEC